MRRTYRQKYYSNFVSFPEEITFELLSLSKKINIIHNIFTRNITTACTAFVECDKYNIFMNYVKNAFVWASRVRAPNLFFTSDVLCKAAISFPKGRHIYLFSGNARITDDNVLERRARIRCEHLIY